MALLARAAGLRRLAGASRAAQAHTWHAFSSATSPAGGGEEDDLVLSAFQQQQKSYRDLLEGMKKIPVPLSLEPAAVKKYANEMEALKRKVGIPDMEEVFNATLNHELSLSGGNVRKFLLAATAGVDLGNQAEVVTKMFAALDKIEAQSGSVTAENTVALQAFEKEVAAIAKRHKLDNTGAIKAQAITDMYAEQLKHLREAASEDIEVAKRRDGLEGIQIDVGSITPKFA